jgi:hypothetical protein
MKIRMVIDLQIKKKEGGEKWSWNISSTKI